MMGAHEHKTAYIFRHAGWGLSMPEHWSHECECGHVIEREPVQKVNA